MVEIVPDVSESTRRGDCRAMQILFYNVDDEHPNYRTGINRVLWIQ